MSEKTIFQKIFDGEIPAKMAFEDEICGAFYDINPQAPTHILVVPKKLIPSISEMADEDANIVGHLFVVAKQIAQDLKLDGGFRLVINNGVDGQQTVPHLHVHILGGRKMTWPPG